MKNSSESIGFQVSEWMKRADDDEQNAHSLLTHRDGTANGVCFLSQQMAEKYLKAFLVATKNWFPKTHLLDNLLESCMEIDVSFEGVKEEAISLSSFYISTRYPGDYPEFSWRDAENGFQAACVIKEFVLRKLLPKDIKRKIR